MERDAGETTNLYGEFPEVVARLSAALDAVNSGSGDPKKKGRKQ
jgi:hypothetical protein